MRKDNIIRNQTNISKVSNEEYSKTKRNETQNDVFYLLMFNLTTWTFLKYSTGNSKEVCEGKKQKKKMSSWHSARNMRSFFRNPIHSSIGQQGMIALSSCTLSSHRLHFQEEYVCKQSFVTLFNFFSHFKMIIIFYVSKRF